MEHSTYTGNTSSSEHKPECTDRAAASAAAASHGQPSQAVQLPPQNQPFPSQANNPAQDVSSPTSSRTSQHPKTLPSKTSPPSNPPCPSPAPSPPHTHPPP